MCPVWKTPGWKPDADKETTFSELSAIVKDIMASYQKIPYRPYVSLSGGEPFLRSDIIEISRFLDDSDIPGFCINSNGTQIKNDQISALRNLRKLHINISLLGPEHVHDRITGKKGSFQQTLTTIKKLRENNFKVTLQTTITSLNQSHLLDICSIAQDLHCALCYNFGQFSRLQDHIRQKEITKKEFSEEFLNTSSVARTFFHINPDILKEQVAAVREKALRSRIPCRFIPDIGLDEIEDYYHDAAYRVAATCPYFFSGITITPSGGLTPCVLHYEICNVKHTGFAGSLGHERFRKLRAYIRKHGIFPVCRHCGYLTKT